MYQVSIEHYPEVHKQVCTALRAFWHWHYLYLSWKITLKVLGYAYLSVCTTIRKFLHRWRDICEALKRACYSLAAPKLPSCQQHDELFCRQCRTPVARAPPTLNLSFVPSALALARSEGMVVQLGQRRETWLINFS